MRNKIAIRASKFLHTLLRNMRRRRKTAFFPSTFPLILLLCVIALVRNLNMSFISKPFDDARNEAIVEKIRKQTVYQSVPKVNASVDFGKLVASRERREVYAETRVAERRAMHRRIAQREREEKRHEGNKAGHEESKAGHEESTAELEGNKAEGQRSDENNKQVPMTEVKTTDMKTAMEGSEKKDGNTSYGTNTTASSSGTRTDGIPDGARVHGKLAEYGGSRGSTEDGMLRGQNITRVSYTLFKIMKLFGFVSLIDSPAGSHSEWIPGLVERMSFDHPSFRYVGVDNEAGVAKARQSMGNIIDGEYVISDVEDQVGNNSDVVFHWTEMDGSERDARSKDYMQHIRKVIIAAKKGDNGYIVFGQFPRLNGPQPIYQKGKWVFQGEEEEPFLYNQHVRGVVPMGNGRQNYMLYMTFYSLRSMPMSQFQV